MGSGDPFDRIEQGIANVRERLTPATHALEAAGIPYAVVGCNAVAHWVATVDEAAVRFTPDVDVMIERTRFEAAEVAMSSVGFSWNRSLDSVLFLDGPDGKPRNAVRIFFAREKVRPNAPLPGPPLDAVVRSPNGYAVLAFHPLVYLELTSFRDKDRMHLRDLIDVGLLSPEDIRKFPGLLGERLQFLFDNPEEELHTL